MFHHAVTLSHGMVGGENKQIPLPETTKVGIFKNVTVEHYAQAKLPCLCFVLHLIFSVFTGFSQSVLLNAGGIHEVTTAQTEETWMLVRSQCLSPHCSSFHAGGADTLTRKTLYLELQAKRGIFETVFSKVIFLQPYQIQMEKNLKFQHFILFVQIIVQCASNSLKTKNKKKTCFHQCPWHSPGWKHFVDSYANRYTVESRVHQWSTVCLHHWPFWTGSCPGLCKQQSGDLV